ncbi:hypothetical protein OH799_27125 [Nocardia sp. NBC_00881]|uniref:hypothetical protein n=1 Tax=Nocardia sp. NBC_00881 TaxID=2975995 RepID=UPI00386E2099|nr:hypothetical protein OH799_27125 [Nocardia sp. NBC_00881]
MSDINGDGHRTRRRAVRSAGPPVEGNETSTTTDVKTSATEVVSARAAVLGAGTSGPAADSGPASVDDADAVTEPDAVASAADTPADQESGVLAKAEAAAAPADEKENSGRRVPQLLALGAAALLVLALVCGATLSVFAVRSAEQRDAHRDEYVQTARQAVVNLTTIRADSAKQDIDRILSLASGEFKTEFDGRVDPFTSIVQQAKVVSNGEIVAAALESDDDRSARVLVAAKQTLTNAGQAEPQTRYYRFRVTVTRGDAGLSVSDVEFVA